MAKEAKLELPVERMCRTLGKMRGATGIKDTWCRRNHPIQMKQDNEPTGRERKKQEDWRAREVHRSQLSLLEDY